jgi:hypothetical protein
MKFIRNITLILISISLISCVNYKHASKSKTSDIQLGATLLSHVPDEALVKYFKISIDNNIILESSSSTFVEKEEAKLKIKTAIRNAIVSADTSKVVQKDSVKERDLAIIDLAQVVAEGEKNKIDMTDDNVLLDRILSLPTPKAARIIRLMIAQLEAKEKNNSNIKKR